MSVFNPALPGAPEAKAKRTYTPGVGKDARKKPATRVSNNSEEGRERAQWIKSRLDEGRDYSEIVALGKDKPWPVHPSVISLVKFGRRAQRARGANRSAPPPPPPQEGAPMPPRTLVREAETAMPRSPLKVLVKQVHAAMVRMGMVSLTISIDGSVETEMDLNV